MSLRTFSHALLSLVLASSCSLAYAEKGDRELTKWEQEAIANEAQEATPEETAEEIDVRADFFITPASGEGIDIYINKTSQTMDVYMNGQPQFHFPVSTARYGYTTPNGSFQVYLMETMHYSKKYDNSPMPFSMFYRGGFAIHGSYAKGFPRYASHGCVRLPPQYAERLYHFVKSNGNGKAAVHISGMDAPASNSKRQVETKYEDKQMKKKKKKGDGFFERLFNKKKKDKKRKRSSTQSAESEFGLY